MTNKDAIFELIKYRRILEEHSTINAEPFDMAVEALEENESLAKSLNDAVELIHKLQKKDDGKWIEIDFRDGTMYGFHQCSVCGARYHCKFDTPPDWNYCPNCGAQMEKESRNERQNTDNI